LTEPAVLILDEPTAGLDPDTRQTVWARVRACRAGGTTVILSTHHRDEAETLCDRMAVIAGGRIADGLSGAAWFGEAARA
ncbi:MAG: hypothetical protein ACM33T_16165, partial [Solirubrobacterales bacterium]